MTFLLQTQEIMYRLSGVWALNILTSYYNAYHVLTSRPLQAYEELLYYQPARPGLEYRAVYSGTGGRAPARIMSPRLSLRLPCK